MKSFFIFVTTVLVSLPAKAQEKSYEQTIPGTEVKFRMIAIRGGSFHMGTNESSADADEHPQHEVALSPFWIGEKEVTFGEWDLFFKDLDIPQTKNIALDAVSRPTAQYIDLTWGMGRDPRQPANSMSHQAAIMYCKWLYERTGVFYRLPTEAEWEYACRAGGHDQKNSSLNGYSKINSGEKFHKTGELAPNAWGLYDMLGNLSEWTLDQYDPEAYRKRSNPVKDPLVPPATKYPKVVRGGSYLDDPRELRCTNRIASDPAWNRRDPQIPKSKWWLTDGMFVGFRLVRPAVQPTKGDIDRFFSSYLK